MAKTAKLKRNAKPISTHSRAAKRASSPSINLDKSITSLPAPSVPRPSALAVQNDAGVKKRKGKGKRLTRHQRLRVEKGVERAEMVMDKREKKVERIVGKEKAMKQRNAAWEELNLKASGGEKKRKVDMTDSKDDEWEDETMDEISGAENGVTTVVDSVPTEGEDESVIEDKTTRDEIL